MGDLQHTQTPWAIGFNTFWWEGLEDPATLDGCLAALKEIGYEAVEFKVDSFQPALAAGPIVRAARAAEEMGLAVSNLVILRGLSDPDHAGQGVADLTAAVAICAEAGIGALNFASGGAPRIPLYPPETWWQAWDGPAPGAWDTLVASLEQVLESAEREGGDLAIEPCVGNLVHDFGSTLELLARCGHDRLMITFDPSHFVLARQDLRMVIERLGDRIQHVHLKDAVGRPGELGRDFLFPLLGEGATDWSVLFKALRDVDYRGAMSVEFESFRFMADVWQYDPLPAARLSKQAADALLRKYDREKD